jgi:hypothetical protein
MATVRPGTPARRGQPRGSAGRLACLLLALGAGRALLGDALEDRRTEAGLKLFRSILAADVDLAKKTVEDGKLLAVFLYTDDRKRAEELAQRLSGGEPLHGLTVVAEVTSDASLSAYSERRPAGVFVAQVPPAAALKSVVQYGISRHVIVYSPFEGHVESGVLAGLAVEAQVRPYLNLATLNASSITLKEFFLKVAKVYR